MVNKIVCSCLLLLSACMVQAQQSFVTAGKIEYERKTNQHAFMEDGNLWDEVMRNNTSKFVTAYFNLKFKGYRTLFGPGREPDIRQERHEALFNSDNIVLTQLDSNQSVTQRIFWNDAFLVTDSLRHIDWRITTDIRKIAGFDCRKAVGLVFDSIIVIAFYTDEIVTPGGPESFSGLPGMIMGLAIPRLHTTWYATKLELVQVTDKEMVAPRKGKKMTGDVFRKQVMDILKQWGEYGRKFQWQFFL